ncbi:phage portal protein [Carnobacterium inhibens]|uniref:phage portal protein n=1 Tax=Carnobacterium inhibens TaxID=147709 RepID=UPI00203D3A1B|nr:phage portal protein [Carnobacterium inhibens]MCM3511648.1 phage portal protein [Carnobacterium inhibens]
MKLPFLNNVLAKREPSPSSSITLKDFTMVYENDAKYKNYALQIAINKLADALALCEFQTFENKKPVQKDNWYLFNIEPNKNQNQSEFWSKVIYKMVYDDNGALVIQSKEGEFVVADDYDISEFAFYENIYSNIVLPGDFRLPGTRKESDVFHFKLHNSEVKKVIDSVYDDYGKLIAGTIRNYNRGNAIKMKLNIGAIFQQFKNNIVTKEDGTKVTEYDQVMDDMFDNRFKGIFTDQDSVTPMEEGLNLDPISATPGNTKSGSVTTRDISNTFEDIRDMVADAFGIPRGILKGDTADNEGMHKLFVNYPVRSLADNLQSEINRKLYGKNEVLKGNKLKIQTNMINTHDPVEFANAGEALLRVGAYSPNDILRKLGEETIDEDWAKVHYVTKNYERTDNLKGGDETNEEKSNSKSNQN